MPKSDLPVALVALMILSGFLTSLPLISVPAYGLEAKQRTAPSLHEQVTKEALKGTICDSNLQIIVLGSDSESTALDNQPADSDRHVRDKNLLKTLNYVEREKRKVLNFCATADVDQKSRVRALYHFGLIVHALQNFYSKSNYLELQLEQLRKLHSLPKGDGLDNIPLVDWNTLISLLRNGEKTNIVVEGYDKSNLSDPEAKLTANGVTYFDLVRDLSVRETERQWQQLESLIKAKLQGNGTAITVSLRDAGCPDQIVSDVLTNGDNLVPEI